jgi:SecD/SecF fusion protein
MLIFYRIMGVAADIALIVYVLLYLWIIVAFGNVLTLPGIAGMILSVGMAVDANVIIFSRIREEVRKGKTIRVATAQGYKRALTTVIDSQVTTLIAGVALYEFGSGDVRGFALTLMIGIVISIFTATVVTNVYLQLMAESKIFATKKMFGIKEAVKIPVNAEKEAE